MTARLLEFAPLEAALWDRLARAYELLGKRLERERAAAIARILR